MDTEVGSIDLILFDFDGVLTDNRVLVMEDGREAVFAHRGDGLGFDILRKVGLKVMIMSTETNQVVTARARKLQIEVFQSVGDKGVTLKALATDRNIDLKNVMYVGNDLNDLSAMKIVGHSTAVGDAHTMVKSVARHQLKTHGGYGIVRELLSDILQIEDKYFDLFSV